MRQVIDLGPTVLSRENIGSRQVGQRLRTVADHRIGAQTNSLHIAERGSTTAGDIPIRYGAQLLGHLAIEDVASTTEGQAFAEGVAAEIALLYKRYEAADACADAFGNREILLGQSAAITQLERTIERLSSWRLPVLIIGEFGSQQRVVASLLHVSGPNSAGPLVSLNLLGCESEDLRSRLPNALKLAIGGTLYLQGLDKLDSSAWYVLCAMLAEHGLLRGALAATNPPVRLIASVEVAQGETCSDLAIPPEVLASVDVIRVRIPPLRSRREDVDAIVRHTAEVLGADSDLVVDDAASAVLRAHDWPGNVDELQRTTARLIVLRQGAAVSADDVTRFAPELVTERDGQPAASIEVFDPPSCVEVAGWLLEGQAGELAEFHPAIQAALGFLHGNYAGEVTARALADHAHVSASHLAHLFKRELGFTFKQLLSQLRIEHAKLELEADRELRITDVALNVGFGDLSHFLKTFRRLVGVSPKEFRQMCAGEVPK